MGKSWYLLDEEFDWLEMNRSKIDQADCGGWLEVGGGHFLPSHHASWLQLLQARDVIQTTTATGGFLSLRDFCKLFLEMLEILASWHCNLLSLQASS